MLAVDKDLRHGAHAVAFFNQSVAGIIIARDVMFHKIDIFGV
jgi:hypothetical protein